MNLGRGGEGSLGGLGLGEGGRCTAPPAVLLDGGGAGGGPRLLVPDELPVFCGLRFAALGGGGGGALVALSFFSASAAADAFFCSK